MLINSKRLHVGQHNSLEKLGLQAEVFFHGPPLGTQEDNWTYIKKTERPTQWCRYAAGQRLPLREKHRTLHTPLSYKQFKPLEKGEKQILSASGTEAGNSVAPKPQAKTHYFWKRIRSKSYLPLGEKRVGQKTLLRARPCTNIKQMPENAGKRGWKLSCTQDNPQIQSKVWLPWGRRQKH